MKKIFAISVLSIMTVLSSNAWASDTSVKEAYGLGSGADYNIATVKFVGETAVPQWAGWHNENKVLRTDGNSNVIFSDTIDQDQVSGLTDALAGKVDDTQIANAAATVATGNMDTMVPTVQRMANAIAAAVESGVGSVDMSSKVDKAQVIKANGTTTLAGTTVDAANLDKDTVAPTIANVEENFAPRVAEVAYNNGQNTYIEKPSDLPYGSYALVVDVYEDTTTYRWVAMSIGNTNSDCVETTAGRSCAN
ncbi:MAG: hypothetical protein IKA73_03965 [Alphaproteobacteria bacterium]|nr:hypothetical protein [Alphaproteobacteria bacterium]